MPVRRLIGPIAVGLAVTLAAGAVDAQSSRLTIDRLVGTPSLFGTAPADPVWSPDSRWVAFLWDDQGRPGRDLWVVERNGTVPNRLTNRVEQGGVREVRWSPSGDLVYLADGNLWRIGVGGGQPRQLTTEGGDRSELAVSPDGQTISYLEAGDLWLVKQGEPPRRATNVGQPTLASVLLGIYARPEVEIGPGVWGGDSPSYAWSPDGRFIAAQLVDRRQVKPFTIPFYLGDHAILNSLRRGAPGETNESRTLVIYDLAASRLQQVDLPDPSGRRIVSFAWSPRGQLLVDREADDAVNRWVDLVDPATRAVTPIWHDRRETRVYNAIGSAWHPDGKRILLLGDLDDWYRLYLLTPGDTVPVPLTRGPFDVTGGPIAVAGSNTIFYLSNEPSPYQRHLFRISDAGGAATRITTRPGHHNAFVSPDGQMVALLSSDDVTPTELYLAGADGKSAERRITRSPPAEFGSIPWVRPRYLTVKSRTDPYPLHVRIFEPPRMVAGRKYPVLFGPVYSNTVRNRWAGLYAGLQQFLVLERGYIVVQVDVRGSTGYGREFREKFLMDWGGGDLDDLESVARELATLAQVDGQRMGIWGSSYGGTLTVFSLFKKPGLFKAGVAGAPAVDPRFFGSDDVAIARTPASHPEAYTRGKASGFVENLRDHLLIIHGMADDVVPFQTTVALIDELIRLGKDFDLAVAPAATHGWTARPAYASYLLKKLVAHFDRYLLSGS